MQRALVNSPIYQISFKKIYLKNQHIQQFILQTFIFLWSDHRATSQPYLNTNSKLMTCEYLLLVSTFVVKHRTHEPSFLQLMHIVPIISPNIQTF